METSEYLNDDSYKDLFDNASDLIHFINLENEILYVNPAWLKTLGFTLDEIYSQSIYDRVRDIDRDRFIHYREGIIQGEPTSRIIFSLVAKNGSIVHLDGEISLRKVDGVPAYTRGIFHDITVKIENDRQIRESEQNLQQLLKHAPDAVIVIDTNNKIIYWNPKAEQMFGWKAEEVIGSSLSDKIVPERFRKGHEEGMRRFLSTGIPHVINNTVDIAAINSSGFEFSVELTVSTTQQNGNKAFVAFIRDTSEKKRNQLELQKRSTQLEKSNQQLQHFAHAASHDMKEPVRKILLFMDRVYREYGVEIRPGLKDYLDKIHHSANRLWDIVQGFLNYAAVESFTDSVIPVDLQGILKSIEEDLEVMIKEKKATLVYRAYPLFPGVPFLIYQLMYNLVANALKFSREGVNPVISINTNFINVKDDEKPSFIEIKIKDNGIGFTAEEGERLFRIFTRLNSPAQYEGSGFGLSLCKNIVERHNGTINAHGSPGEGAIFTVLLPV